jgi:hypothetical protein
MKVVMATFGKFVQQLLIKPQNKNVALSTKKKKKLYMNMVPLRILE